MALATSFQKQQRESKLLLTRYQSEMSPETETIYPVSDSAGGQRPAQCTVAQ
jgi:hypothetical protein